jgi:ComF family protein
MMRAVRDALLAFLLPDTCLSCGGPMESHERHLCGECRLGLRPRPGVVLLPGRPGAARGASGGGEAGPDRAGEYGSGDRAFYALAFEGTARALVHALKYDGRTSVAPELARLAAPFALQACALPPDAAVPVPLHPVRQRERGFNQSALIAGALAAALGVPVLPLLLRVRHSRPQAGLNREARLRLSGAFVHSAVAPVPERVLLVDDVVTTGATLGAAAEALRDAGVAAVTCFAVAGTAPAAPGAESG